VRWSLDQNLYHEKGAPVPPAEIRTPPTAKPKVQYTPELRGASIYIVTHVLRSTSTLFILFCLFQGVACSKKHQYSRYPVLPVPRRQPVPRSTSTLIILTSTANVLNVLIGAISLLSLPAMALSRTPVILRAHGVSRCYCFFVCLHQTQE
jgi:hypothetical protein